MLHGSETWPVRKENEVALQRAEMRMVRWMCDVKVKYESQVKSWERLRIDDVILVLQQNRLRWDGHVMQKQVSHSPGKLLEFYVRRGIIGIISRFMHIKAKCSAYVLQHTFYSKYWHWLHSIMFGSRLVTIAVQMCLIFGCELWPKAPGKFWNWTGKLLENSWDFLLPKEWEPWKRIHWLGKGTYGVWGGGLQSKG